MLIGLARCVRRMRARAPVFVLLVCVLVRESVLCVCVRDASACVPVRACVRACLLVGLRACLPAPALQDRCVRSRAGTRVLVCSFV